MDRQNLPPFGRDIGNDVHFQLGALLAEIRLAKDDAGAIHALKLFLANNPVGKRIDALAEVPASPVTGPDAILALLPGSDKGEDESSRPSQLDIKFVREGLALSATKEDHWQGQAAFERVVAVIAKILGEAEIHKAPVSKDPIHDYILKADPQDLKEIMEAAGLDPAEEAAWVKQAIDKNLAGLRVNEFTSEMVFSNMLRIWSGEQMRSFYEMLSRRPDFNAALHHSQFEGYRILQAGEEIKEGDGCKADGFGLETLHDVINSIGGHVTQSEVGYFFRPIAAPVPEPVEPPAEGEKTT